MKRVFVASSQLRPMAQQLLEMRTPEAYAAVEKYARAHRNDSSGAMAWLAIGYARLQEKKNDAAIPALQSARLHESGLNDYTDLFLAQALAGAGQQMEAASALADFKQRNPDTILARDATIARAEALISAGEASTAVAELEPLRAQGRADVEFLTGKAYEAAADPQKAIAAFTHVYVDFPAAWQAANAANELKKLGTDPEAALTAQQRRKRADLLYSARKYSDAASEYSVLLRMPELQSAPDAMRIAQVKYAAALWKQNRKEDAIKVLDPISEQPLDDAGAERLYLYAEQARNKDDVATNSKVVNQLVSGAPASVWTQEALLSAGNMYLLKKDYPNAVKQYLQLAAVDEHGRLAGYAHWKGTWLTFHTGDGAAARPLFEEQIEKWTAGEEIPAALYWSGRLALEQGRKQDAKAYFSKLSELFQHYYYGYLAEAQLQQLKDVTASAPAELAKVKQLPTAPDLEDAPEDDPHVEKARLLNNAGLTDYALRELQFDDDGAGSAWAPGEIARMYITDQKPYRALQSLKHYIPGYFSYDIDDIPRFYWEVLFPRPYWNDLKAFSSEEGLDPYLVASLIRQESEFNPNAHSPADAYGLMQLLPSAAKQMAKEVHMRHYDPSKITDPQVNLRLGTHYFKKTISKYGGQAEYALAAYNAGDNRVDDWKSDGHYRDIYEFVESIPFTETREYVQAIMRNARIYADLYSGAKGRPALTTEQRQPDAAGSHGR